MTSTSNAPGAPEQKHFNFIAVLGVVFTVGAFFLVVITLFRGTNAEKPSVVFTYHNGEFPKIVQAVSTTKVSKASAYIFSPVHIPDYSVAEPLGVIHFVDLGHGLVEVNGTLHSLPPGLHVHQFGEVKHECFGSGARFSPLKKKHGAPADRERHVGDLGNIRADENGDAFIDLLDRVISFEGIKSIIGRAVVVDQDRDHFGRVRGEQHATRFVGCGVIGIVEEEEDDSKCFRLNP